MIPPHELKHMEFTRGIRGYNTQEVDAQIAYLIQSYTELYRHTAEMEKAYTDLYRRYKEATADRDTVKSDLIDARLASDQIIAAAEEKAEMIVRASKTNCDYIINDFRRTVANEREKLVNIHLQIVSLKEKLMNECREYMDRIDELSDISDTVLYYSDDDELVARAMDEIKTDVRYAIAEKTQLDTISDEDAEVDLAFFSEELPDPKEPSPDATRTDVFFGSKVKPEETIQLPDEMVEGYSRLLKESKEANK